MPVFLDNPPSDAEGATAALRLHNEMDSTGRKVHHARAPFAHPSRVYVDTYRD